MLNRSLYSRSLYYPKRNISRCSLYISVLNQNLYLVGISSILFGTICLISRYKLSKPNHYLIRSGLGIKDILISKNGFQWPFQTYKFIDIKPKVYIYKLYALTFDNKNIELFLTIYIGSLLEHNELIKYAKLISNIKNHDQYIDLLIEDMIEYKFNIISSSLNRDEIMKNRQNFYKQLLNGIQKELNLFGLKIYDNYINVFSF